MHFSVHFAIIRHSRVTECNFIRPTSLVFLCCDGIMNIQPRVIAISRRQCWPGRRSICTKLYSVASERFAPLFADAGSCSLVTMATSDAMLAAGANQRCRRPAGESNDFRPVKRSMGATPPYHRRARCAELFAGVMPWSDGLARHWFASLRVNLWWLCGPVQSQKMADPLADG